MKTFYSASKLNCMQIDSILEPLLYNYYGVIPINPEKCPDVKFEKANIFIDWLISPETMQLISSYKLKNQQLFFPIN